MKFKLAQKYVVEFQEDQKSDSDSDSSFFDTFGFGSLRSAPYTVERLYRKRGHIARKAWCVERILKKIGHQDTVVEHFAGFGINSTQIQAQCTPVKYMMFDLAPVCLRQLSRRFPHCEIRRASFENSAGIPADFTALDFNTFSLLAADAATVYALERVLLNSKKLMITDSAMYRIHLNQKAYTNQFGCPINDLMDYLKYMSGLFHKRTGKAITMAAHTFSVTVILLEEKRKVGSIDLIGTPPEASSYFVEYERDLLQTGVPV